MLRRYKAILFDMDGTLVDTRNLWKRHIERVLLEEGLITEKEIWKVVEVLESGRDPLRTLLPHLDDDEIKKLYWKVRKRFLDDLDEVKPLFTREDLLFLLDGRPAAVVTLAHSVIATKVLKAMDVYDLFDAVITSDKVSSKKPHPEPLWRAMDEIGRTPVAYIGDSQADEEAALRAGVDFYHVRAVRRYVQGTHI